MVAAMGGAGFEPHSRFGLHGGVGLGCNAADDDEVKKPLDLDYQKNAAKLQAQNKAYKDFCEKNGLKTRAERTQIAKWDREQARQASGAAQRYKTYQKELDKYSQYHYNEDGTIKVTDDLKGKHVSAKAKYKPFAVVETQKDSNGQIDRIYYDKDAMMCLQIHSGNHNIKNHPHFGNHDEHAHDILWADGKIVGRPMREINEKERKENLDIL